jgi:hypothetical protein
MLRTREQAQAELGDVAPLLEGAIRTALERYPAEHATQRRDYSRRSQSSLIHDLMVAETKKQMEGRSGVVCMTTKGTFVVVVRQTYIIKLKKMGSGLQTSNIRTQALLSFMNQKPMQLTLAAVPAETHLIFGYQPRGTELLSSSVWAICPMGKRVRWSWTLETAAPIVRMAPAELASDQESLYAVRDEDAKPAKKVDEV